MRTALRSGNWNAASCMDFIDSERGGLVLCGLWFWVGFGTWEQNGHNSVGCCAREMDMRV